MIHFCDKVIYKLQRGEMTRVQMMDCLETDKRIVILIYDNNDNYYGFTDYYKLANSTEESGYIQKKYLIADDLFWDTAKQLFQVEEDESFPVFDKKGNVLGFCYNKNELANENNLVGVLEAFEQVDEISVLLSDLNSNCKQVFIMDFNEAAYRLYRVLKKFAVPVCVFGEKWEWFEISQLEGFHEYPEYARMYIYAEGTPMLRARTEKNRRKVLIDSGFEGLFYWGKEMKKISYKHEIEKLCKKGISVCKVILPDINDMEYFTDDELKGFYLQSDPALYTNRETEACVRLRNENIVSLIGGKVIEKYTKDGNWSDWYEYKKITYNKAPAEIMYNGGYQRKVYVVGSCIVRGVGALRTDTMCSYLQEKIGTTEGYVIVKVYIPVCRFDLIQSQIEQLPIRKGDIVLFVDVSSELPDKNSGCREIDLMDIYNDVNRKNLLFGCDTRHTNKTGNKVVAQAIYDRFLKEEMARLNREVTDHSYVQKGEVLSEELQQVVFEYVKNVKNWNEGDVGCIIMNCNPFTLGHQYLIEYAAKQMDKLYIFVVEENRSFFTFEERFEMVKKGTEHLANVHVVPSGEWVLSFKTLPIYFEKAKMQEEKVDAQMDLEIFARYIAPVLGIKKRFVGEEPTDKVTRQYNEQMKRILNEFDIEVEEIPRKEMNGRPISASYVRKCIEEACFEELKDYVPQSTYTMLLSK